MTVYTCEKCNQEFKQKNDYTRHINKKYPCITQEDLKNKVTEDESLKQLESFFLKLRDLLRDYENITGDKALDVITDFLFLRLLNYEIETNKEMDIISNTYKRKIKIEQTEYDLDEYKKYFKWDELIKIVNNIDKDSKNQENKLLLTNVLQHIIFNGLLKFNNNTKAIYRNRRFYVQKTVTLIKLIKEFNKIDFSKYDVDIKGKAYELTIQKEGATNKDFSQFFTPRWIDRYMIHNADIKINKDGSYTKIMDPACGTAGILSEYLSLVKKNGEKEDIIIDNDVSKYLYGSEIVDDTLKIAHMNILLKAGSYDKSIVCKDFLEVGCLDYIDNKFDGNIIMNPPFSISKTYDLQDDDMKKVYNVETKSGTMLFLMAGLNSIVDKRQLIAVSPNGKEIFNKNKEYINIRKHIVDTANVYKIAMLPEGSFKPYTGVQTLVLMMRKGEKTKEIQFVNVIRNKDDTTKETEICKVTYKQLQDNNYSWNYKEYIDTNDNKYKDIEYKKLAEICEFLPKSKRPASFGQENGNFNFYTSSQNVKKCDECDYKDTCMIIGTGGNANIKYDSNFSCSADNFILKSNNIITTKYVYYYFLSNMYILENGFNGTTIKHISKDYIKDIEIPIPSLDIQNHIIKELESLYKQKESLTSSINEMSTVCKCKLELMLSNHKNIKINDLCEFLPKSKRLASFGQENGNFNFYTSSTNVKKCDECDYKDTCMIIGTGGNANIKYDSNFSCSADNFILKSNNIITTKYIYYYFLSNMYILENGFNGTTIKHISKDYIKDIEIPVPSLTDQQKIVDQLYKYDILDDLQNKQIKDLDKLIKDRFNFHLQQCKDNQNKIVDKKDIIEELSDNSEEEKEDIKPKKVVKKKVEKSSESSKSKSSEEEEVKPKKKVKAKSK